MLQGWTRYRANSLTKLVYKSEIPQRTCSQSGKRWQGKDLSKMAGEKIPSLDARNARLADIKASCLGHQDPGLV